jgi:GTP cyclohydrolase II
MAEAYRPTRKPEEVWLMPTNIELPLRRETATYEREIAESRTFTEEEHVAILASTVSREGAAAAVTVKDLQAKVDALTAQLADCKKQLDAAKKEEVGETAAFAEKVTATAAVHETEKAELQNKLDLEVAARETAEKALADRNTEIEHDREVAARQDARVAGVRTALPHKADEWFTPERANRWALMEQDAFDGYVAELAEVTAGLEKGPVKTDAPRETAMHGVAVTSTASKTSAFFEQNRKGI